ncbi:MAG TPA: sigma 54-interacting transcriptional regulator, partial [Labilithrix sp.]|nr:sigma 54-interacting transcriptional regulator [Labilithrix sp.]
LVEPSPASWELIVTIDGRTRVHALPSNGALVLGRSGGSDICVDHPSVSRRHARLLVEPERIVVEDLGSANGSRIVTVIANAQHTAETKEERLEPGSPVVVPAAASIHLGSVVVLVRHAVADAASSVGAATDIVAESPAMKHVLALVERIAQAPLSVLFVGETGVGKDVVAQALHAASPRKSGPFVAINCAALAESLVESELFGHERGAFTGASAPKAGLLEEASGGTVFLDEIGELPPTQQSKLLRVLEERTVTRVGSVRPRAIDVRFVAATNRDPARDAEEGAFRRDLYFRLSGMTVAIPPLRERPEDLEPLAQLFAKRAARELGRAVPTFHPDALSALRAHPFPGNVRELRNVVERAITLATDVVTAEHLVLGRAPSSPKVAAQSPAPPTGREAERQRIVDALARCAGNQTRAAVLLGISRRTLVSRLTEFGIARPLRPRED